MYISNESIMNYIEADLNIYDSVIKNLLISIYNNLLKNDVIQASDVMVLEKWLEYFV